MLYQQAGKSLESSGACDTGCSSYQVGPLLRTLWYLVYMQANYFLCLNSGS